MDIASEAAKSAIPEWPDESFNIKDTNEAILKTPTPFGVAWFLTNRKKELGARAPTKVIVKTIHQYSDEPQDQVHFMFDIAPVKKPTV